MEEIYKQYIRCLEQPEYAFRALPSDYFTFPYDNVISQANSMYKASKCVDLRLINTDVDFNVDYNPKAFQFYEKLIRENYAERKLRQFTFPTDVTQASSELSLLTIELNRILEGETKSKDIKDLVEESLADLTEKIARQNSGTPIYDISWGFRGIDDLCYGVRPIYAVIAARPSMGKTLVAGEIAKSIAKSGHHGVFFSKEMRAVDITSRLIYSESGIEGYYYNTGQINTTQYSVVADSAFTVSDLPLIIDDKAIMTPEYICNRTLQLVNEGKCEFIVVDYLQKLDMGHLGKDEYPQITAASSMFQNLMKEANIPVIVLSQLNRSVESRPNKIPQMSDLRGSGGIEQDADMVAFLYRPEYYGRLEDENGQPVGGTIDFIIEKNRGGRLGTVKLYHDNMSRISATPFVDTTNYATFEPKMLVDLTQIDNDIPF